MVGSFFTAVADNILLISAQESLIKSVEDEQKAIDDYNNMLKNMKLTTSRNNKTS